MYPDTTSLCALLRRLAAESCLKIGLTLPALSLNLPPDSLCRLLKASPQELPGLLRDFPGLYTPGDCTAAPWEESYCFTLSAPAIARAVQEEGASPFLRELIALALREFSAISDYQALFSKYGKPCFTPFQGEEFDLLCYYPGGLPDPFYYCLKQEGPRCDYHRFTPEDYAAFHIG